MSETTDTTKEAMEEQQKRLLEAGKSLEGMEEEIAPFVKRRKIRKYTTTGEWRDSSEYERTDFFHDLKKASRRVSQKPSQPDSEKR